MKIFLSVLYIYSVLWIGYNIAYYTYTLVAVNSFWLGDMLMLTPVFLFLVLTKVYKKV